MSARFVRQSKFRHVFGQALKRDQCYDNIRITRNSWESKYCAVNPKYVAIITEAAGGGSFMVLPLDKTGRVDMNMPQVTGHRGPVLDVAWCPHNDDIIASASEDCTVKVWQIPDGGPRVNLHDPVADLVGHQRRVGLVAWHPTASNVLLSLGSDNKMFVWNAGTEEVIAEVDFPDLPLCASWNWDGSRIVVSCKDKKVRIVDARSGEIIKTSFAHEGTKPVQVQYLKDGRIFTTGFSRMSERQYALWDGEMNNIVIMEIDHSNGIMFPFYDSDNNVMFLCGKGDALIRYYEITDEQPYVHFLNLYQSSEPQRGINWMPKRGCNVNNNEIARFYKLHQKGMCEVIPFTVPRKSELFQDDLYPDTVADEPALTAEEWLAGKDATPILMSMRDHFTGGMKVPKSAKKPNLLQQVTKKHDKTSNAASAGGGSAASAPAAAPAATSAPSKAASQPSAASSAASVAAAGGVDIQTVLDDIRKLKIIVKGHERRILKLEEKIAQYEGTDSTI